MTDADPVAYAYYPTGDPRSGAAWFNNSSGVFDAPRRGNYAWMAFIHETSHALGLKHGHEFPAISSEFDSLEYSVMTYRSYPGAPADGGYLNETFGFPQSLMMYDIAALQQIYGADYGYNAGNTVYRWSPTTGQMFINGVGQERPGDNRVFQTIWDGGGNDTYDLSNYTTHVRIDLRPGEWTTTSEIQLANLGDFHTARGNVANALLHDGNTASLVENAIGGSSGDAIIANEAANRLTGGRGADVFVFHSVMDSPVGAADLITDFVSGGDESIILEGIDADATTEANDTFRFIGTDAFRGTAGELRYETEGDRVHIFGDVDGDAIADLHIIVNSPTLVIHDFYL